MVFGGWDWWDGFSGGNLFCGKFKCVSTTQIFNFLGS